ncbi:MAG: alkane 1-monooxygenase, partial [Cellulosimicrobium cellulans]
VGLFFGGGREFTDDEADMVLDSPQGQHVSQMMTYSAVGTPDAVIDYLDGFAKHSDADELIVAHQNTGTEARIRSVELLAEVAGLARVGANSAGS